MGQVLYKIVEIEGPVHEEELVARVRDLRGKERAGPQIQDAVARATRSLLIGKRCSREDSCLRLPRAVVPIRDRGAAASTELRTPRLLPSVELRAAIVALVRQHHGAAPGEIPGEIPAATARLLGFKATGAALRSVIDALIAHLLESGVLIESDGMLRVANN